MGDVLSQSEIDNLLSALNSGEFDPTDTDVEDEKQVKDYNFARPSKFSKDHLRTLVFIFEHYARLLSTNLPVYLRRNVQVEVMHAEATGTPARVPAAAGAALICSPHWKTARTCCWASADMSWRRALPSTGTTYRPSGTG